MKDDKNRPLRRMSRSHDDWNDRTVEVDSSDFFSETPPAPSVPPRKPPEPPRKKPASSGGSTTGTTTATTKSPKTGDMGVVLYAATALLSLSGTAVVIKKRKNDK